jgi:hypothetical protein
MLAEACSVCECIRDSENGLTLSDGVRTMRNYPNATVCAITTTTATTTRTTGRGRERSRR